MLSLALVAGAAAVLTWPGSAGRARLARRMPMRAQHRPCLRGAAAGKPLVLILALAGGTLLGGVGTAVAVAAVVATAASRWKARRARRVGSAAASGLVDALGLLVAELRVGAHPAAAMEAAAADSADPAASALGTAAAAARLGGDVPAALRAHGGSALQPWLERVAEAWSLAVRHGIALADLLDAVRVDLEHRVRFAAEVDARLAGPRASAAVLAGLPVLGLLLGQAVGADPVAVLLGSAWGQALLVVGTLLACAGVLWSARIVAAAVPG